MNNEDDSCELAKIKFGCDKSSRIKVAFVINALLAIASLLWHYFLHGYDGALLYDPSVPIVWGYIIAAIDIVAFILFFGSKKSAMIGALIQLSIVILGVAFMTKYVYVIPELTNDAYSISILMLIDIINYFLAMGSIGKKQ